jgi:hypothetical protein
MVSLATATMVSLATATMVSLATESLQDVCGLPPEAERTNSDTRSAVIAVCECSRGESPAKGINRLSKITLLA